MKTENSCKRVENEILKIEEYFYSADVTFNLFHFSKPP